MKDVKLIDKTHALDDMDADDKQELLKHLLQLSIMQAAFIEASFRMHKWAKHEYSLPKPIKKALKQHQRAGQTLLDAMPVKYSIKQANSEDEMKQMIKDLAKDISIENEGEGWKH